MSKLDELRQHGGSFPGVLYNILAEFDARIAALETHKPMLDSIKPDYDREMQRRLEAEQPEATPQQPEATPAGQPAIRPPENQPVPNPGTEGVQS